MGNHIRRRGGFKNIVPNGSELALLLVLIGGWLDSNRASLLLPAGGGTQN